MEIGGKCLKFGVLIEPAKMMIMACVGDVQRRLKFVLNLDRKEIDIEFPWRHISPNGSAVRTFRFAIALDEELKFWQMPDRSFVFHVCGPPWYYKQLAEAVANTHSPDTRLWSIEDTWARRTDLRTYKQHMPEIDGAPITLPKYFNDINIFRWTTFRFDPVSNDTNMYAAQQSVNALRDCNVKVQEGVSFQVSYAEARLDEKAWDLINSTHFDEDMATPASGPYQVKLPFSVRYQLEVCLSSGWLSEYSVTSEFLQRISGWQERRAKQALLYVATDQKRIFDPMRIFDDIHYSKHVRAKRLPENCIEVCSATVTSTGLIFHTLNVEIANRVIQHHKSHAHRFLRVRVEDDNYRGQRGLCSFTNNKTVMIFARAKRALSKGIRLGNVTYDFLAWGNAQFRERGACFFAAEDGVTATTR